MLFLPAHCPDKDSDWSTIQETCSCTVIHMKQQRGRSKVPIFTHLINGLVLPKIRYDYKGVQIFNFFISLLNQILDANYIFPLNKLLTHFLEQRLIYAQMFPETLHLLHMSAVSSWSARVNHALFGELEMWWSATSSQRTVREKESLITFKAMLSHYMNAILSCSAQKHE